MINFWNWYTELFTKGDGTILAATSATIAAATFILNFIIKQLFKSDIVVELLKSFVLLFFRFWYIALIVISGLVIFNETAGLLGNYFSVRFVSILIVVLFIFDGIASLIQSRINNNKSPSITIYGCFSINDNKSITVDTTAEELNQKIKSVINSVSEHYSYRSNFVEIHFKEFPKIVPLFLGYTKLNDKIKGSVYKGQNVSSLHFIRNKVESKLTVTIYYNEKNLANPDPIQAAEKFLNNLAFSSNLNNIQIVELSVKIYLFLFSLSHLDILLDRKEYDKVHYTLDSCDKLVLEIKNDLAKISKDYEEQVQQFLTFWMSTFERYRSLAFLEQKEFSAAIKHIFNAISLNPHFPYESYEILMPNYSKRYGIELLPSLNGAQEFLEFSSSEQLENLRVVEELSSQVKFKDATYHYQIVHELMRRGDKVETVKLIEDELSKLDSKQPFILVTKSEILKHLEKGSEKINEIYLERFDECIRNLKEALILDPNFILIHTKLATLLFLNGIHFSNDTIIDEAVNEYKKGLHFMTQLGFRMTIRET